MNMAKLPGDSVDVPLLGSSGGNLRFELLLAGGDSLESKDDPFLPLSDSSRFARVLLGRVVSGVDYTLHPIAVKIQRSFYRPAASGSAKETLTNPLQRFLVAIHPYKPAARLYLLQNGFRMTAQSESGIDEDPSGPAHQEIEDFVEEHRLMLGRKALRRCLHSGCPYMLVQARPI